MQIRVNLFGDFVAKDASSLKVGSLLRGELEQGAYNVVNFEAPVEGVGRRISKSGPCLCQSRKSPDFLKNNGFNVISIANNHTMDYGVDGCAATIGAFSKDVIVVGAGKLADAYKQGMVDLGGARIGFLSATHAEFGTLGLCAGETDFGTAWLNSPNFLKAINSAKKEVDFLIVLPHAGIEYMDAPLPEYRELYRHFIDFGADAVVASHPHQIQGWEDYNGKPIFYSLGNLYFDVIKGKDKWYQSLMVSLVFDTDCKKVQYDVKGVYFDPNGVIELDETNAIIDRALGLCNFLNRKDYLTYVDNFCLNQYPKYKYQVLRGLYGLSFMNPCFMLRLCANFIRKSPDKHTLLNNIRCESHRWLLQRIISIK